MKVRGAVILLSGRDACRELHCPRVVSGPGDLKFEVRDPSSPEIERFQYARPMRPKWSQMRPVYNSWRKLVARITHLDDEPCTAPGIIVSVFLAWLAVGAV